MNEASATMVERFGTHNKPMRHSRWRTDDCLEAEPNCGIRAI
jgi:hypothetical protein